MATLAQLRTGLKTRLETISGLNCYAVKPGKVTPPCAWVRPMSGEYRGSLAGSPSTKFQIVVMVPITDLDNAQEAIDPYLAESGAQSIFAAINGDRTLAGIADDLLVSDWTDYDSVNDGGTDYLSARITVEVYH